MFQTTAVRTGIHALLANQEYSDEEIALGHRYSFAFKIKYERPLWVIKQPFHSILAQWPLSGGKRTLEYQEIGEFDRQLSARSRRSADTQGWL